jgi:hypothetical protein
LGDQWGIAASLTNLGWARLKIGTPANARLLFEEGLVLWRAMGDKASIAECLEGLAAALGACDQPVPAAYLAGAAEKLREDMGLSIGPTYRTTYAYALTLARSQLDLVLWKSAWTQGRAMALEQIFSSILTAKGRIQELT